MQIFIAQLLLPHLKLTVLSKNDSLSVNYKSVSASFTRLCLIILKDTFTLLIWSICLKCITVYIITKDLVNSILFKGAKVVKHVLLVLSGLLSQKKWEVKTCMAIYMRSCLHSVQVALKMGLFYWYLTIFCLYGLLEQYRKLYYYCPLKRLSTTKSS